MGDDSLGSATPSAPIISRYLGNTITLDENTGAGTYYSYYEEITRHKLLHSNARTDALVLEALCVGNPSSNLISKLVKGLLERRKDGRWENTQENCWVVMALDRYFQGNCDNRIMICNSKI